MTNIRYDRHAFSLVELLVVIGIIAIVVSILLPVIGKARQAAESTVCLSNQRQIFVLLTAWSIEHDGRVMSGFNDELLTTSSSPQWPCQLEEFRSHQSPITNFAIRDNSFKTPYYCPSWLAVDQEPANLGYTGFIGAFYPTSYMINIGVMVHFKATPGPGTSQTLPKFSQFHRPSETMLMIDASRDSTTPGIRFSTQFNQMGTGLAFDRPILEARHGIGVNALFVDGHSMALSVDSLKADAASNKPGDIGWDTLNGQYLIPR